MTQDRVEHFSDPSTSSKPSQKPPSSKQHKIVVVKARRYCTLRCKPRTLDLSMETMSSFFHMPLDEAAKKLVSQLILAHAVCLDSRHRGSLLPRSSSSAASLEFLDGPTETFRRSREDPWMIRFAFHIPSCRLARCRMEEGQLRTRGERRPGQCV